MGNEAWSKIQLHGNLELKNLMTVYTLNLRINLEYFSKSILYMLYIVSKLRKSGAQRFKCVQIGAEMKKLWPFKNNYAKLKGHFEMNSKFNLWIRNSLWNDANFEFTHCHFDVSFPLPRELDLGHSIYPKWIPHDQKLSFYYFFKSFLGNYFVISGQWECATC